METMTAKQAAIEIVAAIGSAIKELGEASASELYAHVMTRLSYQEFVSVIEILAKCELITVSGYRYKWIGD